ARSTRAIPPGARGEGRMRPPGNMKPFQVLSVTYSTARLGTRPFPCVLRQKAMPSAPPVPGPGPARLFLPTRGAADPHGALTLAVAFAPPAVLWPTPCRTSTPPRSVHRPRPRATAPATAAATVGAGLKPGGGGGGGAEEPSARSVRPGAPPGQGIEDPPGI